ncbi:MAG: DUF134 domain-containing protein [Bacteroidetes bacterium]|nr:DUF134 domain-containing protein [Bacteroidota bacterium]
MPRPQRTRRIFGPPRFNHFKPVGVPRRLLETVTLTVDEFEAIRLADYEGLDQQPASEKMDISRSTFSRLIDAARAKIARCIIEGMELRIEGGEVDFEHSLQRCEDCGDELLQRMAEARKNAEAVASCRVCGSENVKDLAWGTHGTHGRGQGRGHGQGSGQHQGKGQERKHRSETT